VARIKQESGSDRVELGLMDLSSLESVRAFAEGYVRSGRPLHVLILNAGVMPMLPQARTTTPDGFELYALHYLPRSQV
jgi:NAD(P)-dependent dehydrogenase (short-subunit alcohol dehydrogenase family)